MPVLAINGTHDAQVPYEENLATIRVPDALCLTRRDASRNMARFYRMQITPDLFGGAVLFRNWGRIGTQGQKQRQWWSDDSGAEMAMQDWAARKIRKGYRPAHDMP